MLDEHEVIALTVDLPEQGLRVGDTGTIVYVAPNSGGYIVEFMNFEGDTVALVDLMSDQVRRVAGTEIRSVRPLVPA